MNIEIPQDHTAEDLKESGVLKPETVKVRFTRSSEGVWTVEVSLLDAEWTFTCDVAAAIERQTGLKAREDFRRSINVYALGGKKYKAPRGFVRVDQLPLAK
jgi:hypothetical protein